MSFFALLETLLIGPIKLIFEIIYELSSRFIGHPGLAIIMLSLIMNILILPLYRRADAMQEETRDVEAKLHDGVVHIKKTFSGDERMMILQTYYRQNHYKPTDVLNGSVSLLLEIPFFIAAYQFLSHLEILNGVSLGPIKDLGAPDGLLVIGGMAINVLPIIMTLINFISSALYLKGFPMKTKVQIYGMALFFLIFLYGSPACLVFYWTLNNVFSLVKTIFYKLKNPRKVLRILTAAIGLLLLVYGIFAYHPVSVRRKAFLIAVAVLLMLPTIAAILRSKIPVRDNKVQPKPNRKVFLLSAVFLTVLIGLLIPSTFIAASPQEFVDITYFRNPLWYIASTLCMAAGTFLVWMNVVYWVASPKGKTALTKIMWILCGVMLVNYMFFGTNLGIISANLQYETGLAFTQKEQLINLLVMTAVVAAMYICVNRWDRFKVGVLLTAIIALGGMSVMHMVTIKDSVNEIELSSSDRVPTIQLSKTGKNVVVIMLDRAVNGYIPYFFSERPELEKQFAGFTYYDNTISFGEKTNFGAPALFGGYEYTPVEINKRASEPLVSKHNEALKVMPVLFAENGYEVTVCDPTYANYQWIPDLTIFDDYPDIKTYITKGRFGDPAQKERVIKNNDRNFFCFGILKSMPLFLQSTIYDNGRYIQAGRPSDEVVYSTQTRDGMSVSSGIGSNFMDPYNVLCSLPVMTEITDSGDNTFMVMTNDTTHEPNLLQEPDYTPAMDIDNTEYDLAHTDRFTCNGRTLNMQSELQMIHYQTNMAAMIQLGKWFDYLRENDVYDNTRIIIVADHGQPLGDFDELVMDDGTNDLKNVEGYYPLLLVKDFDSREFTTSHEFMTNADVPTLATKDLISNPTNPFTGNAINSNEKTAHDQYIIMSMFWDVTSNNGNTYAPAPWASVKDDLWNKDNWTFSDEEQVLAQHALP